MDDFTHAAFETGKEILKDTSETVGEQIGTKKEKGTSHGLKDQFNFWDEFKNQVLNSKTPEQLQQEAQLAQQGEKGRTPQQLAEARKRLQELNAPSQPTPRNGYEYKGPDVPNQQANSTQLNHNGSPIPQQPQVSDVDFTNSPETRQKQFG